MLIAIDETGSFGPTSGGFHLFVAVHFRRSGPRLERKYGQFLKWERSLPKSLKNHKGEFKGSALSDAQLLEFAQAIIGMAPTLGFTPVAIRPSDQPPDAVRKHRHVLLFSIRECVKGYVQLERPAVARTYEELGNWFSRIHDSQFLKIFLLGECIGNALVNAVGHAVSGRYDLELPDLQIVIDRDFIKERRHLTFWKAILKDQLLHFSKTTPLPLLKDWRETGHPFLTKFTRNGKLDFNELFVKNCSFASSHEHPELRIADLAATIASRYFNRRSCAPAYSVLRQFFLRDRKVTAIVLNDFDLDAWRYDPNDNPYL